MTDLHYINELHSDLRGGKEGWYAIDERGNLLLGPFSNRENCLTGISQPCPAILDTAVRTAGADIRSGATSLTSAATGACSPRESR